MTQKQAFSRKSNPSTTFDNTVNRINKRIQNRVNKLGTQDVTYTNMASLIIQSGAEFRMAKSGAIQLKRSKANQRPSILNILNVLDARFETVGETYARVTNNLKRVGKPVTHAAIKAEINAEFHRATAFDEAMQYLYDEANSLQDFMNYIATQLQNGSITQDEYDVLLGNASAGISHRTDIKTITNLKVRRNKISKGEF